jgi:hypothetical protein
MEITLPSSPLRKIAVAIPTTYLGLRLHGIDGVLIILAFSPGGGKGHSFSALLQRAVNLRSRRYTRNVLVGQSPQVAEMIMFLSMFSLISHW